MSFRSGKIATLVMENRRIKIRGKKNRLSWEQRFFVHCLCSGNRVCGFLIRHHSSLLLLQRPYVRWVIENSASQPDRNENPSSMRSRPSLHRPPRRCTRKCEFPPTDPFRSQIFFFFIYRCLPRCSRRLSSFLPHGKRKRVVRVHPAATKRTRCLCLLHQQHWTPCSLRPRLSRFLPF